MPLSSTDARKLDIFRGTFKGRSDIFGAPNKREKGQSRCVKSPLTEHILLDHLRGKRLIGVYPLVRDRVWFAAIDIDQPDPEPVIEVARIGRDIGLTPLIEKSKSKGFHLWFYSDEQGWLAERIRAVLRWMCKEIDRPEVEVFPKQDRLQEGQFGNFIYLPLNGRLVSKGRTIFVESTRWMPPVASQWDALAHRPRYSAEHLNKIVEDLDLSNPLQRHARSDGGSEAGECATNQNRSEMSSVQQDRGGFGLPPCARRMLAEGVTEQQRVACFRLAVHLHRLGIPQDLAKALLIDWSKKNRPVQGKRIITADEITQQTCDGYSGRYRGYGCEDPAVAQYCQGQCPIAAKSQRKTARQSATNRTVRPLQG